MADDSPESLRNRDILDKTANAAPVIFLGHKSHFSNETGAVERVMPQLRQSNVGALAIEISPSGNPVLKKIQEDINQGAGFDAVKTALGAETEKEGMQMTRNRLSDLTREVVAATRNGIQVVGIDPRATVEGYGTFNTAMEELLDFDKNPLGTSAGDQAKQNFLQALLGRDQEAASNALSVLNSLPKDQRLAISYGEVHDKGPGEAFERIFGAGHPQTLVEALRSNGTPVTVMSAGNKNLMESLYPAVSGNESVSPAEPIGQVLQKTPAFNPKP